MHIKDLRLRKCILCKNKIFRRSKTMSFIFPKEIVSFNYHQRYVKHLSDYPLDIFAAFYKLYYSDTGYYQKYYTEIKK